MSKFHYIIMEFFAPLQIDAIRSQNYGEST